MHEVRHFLLIAAQHLTAPIRSDLCVDVERKSLYPCSRSSSTFTTFDGLECGARYWYGELPLESDLFENYVRDAAWGFGGPVNYDDVAHILIPRLFYEEFTTQQESADTGEKPLTWNCWDHEQDIRGLSELLDKAGVNHHLTDRVLEIRRY